MKIIIPVIIGTVLATGLIWLWASYYNKPKQAGPITLNYWGFWDEEKMRPIITEYGKAHPNIKIVYTKQQPTFYRTRVQTQMREGAGPDILQIRNSWLPLISQDLAPAPNNSLNDFIKTFYPVARDSLTINDQIYALPLEINGLALFYNEDILKAAGVNPPKTWQQFLDGVTKVTVKDGGQVKTSGAAMGTTNNIDFWPEILGLLLLQQPGVNLSSPANNQTSEILKFYTSFIIDPRRKTWDSNLPPSTQMFALGNLAFYFGSFEKITEIKQLNSNLKFAIVPVPQLPGGQTGWALFWAEAVSRHSKYQAEAWEFVNFLTEKQVIASLGVPSSRVDMRNTVTDPLMQPFVAQGYWYKSWYLQSSVSDSGINDEMISVWKEAVDAVLAGTPPESVLTTLQPKVQQILTKYKK